MRAKAKNVFVIQMELHFRIRKVEHLLQNLRRID